MIRVLFLCVHNSARSQMAEAFLNDYGEGLFVAESAGLEPGVLNPVVVKAMDEIGYDIKDNQVDDVFKFFQEGRTYTFVVTVCAQSKAQKCPVFPQVFKTIDWDIEDPSAFEGTPEEVLEKTRVVRDGLLKKVKAFIEEYRDFAKSRV